MLITIQLDTENAADQPTLAALLAATTPSEAAKPAKPEKPAKKPVETVKGNPDAPVDLPVIKTTTDTVTRADVAPVISQLVKEKGRAVAVELLEKFRPDGFAGEAVRVPDISEARYPELLAAAKAALK